MNNLLLNITTFQALGVLFAIIVVIGMIVLATSIIEIFIKENDQAVDVVVISQSIKKTPEKIRKEYDSLYVEEKLKTNKRGAIAKADTDKVVAEIEQKIARIPKVKKVKTE